MRLENNFNTSRRCSVLHKCQVVFIQDVHFLADADCFNFISLFACLLSEYRAAQQSVGFSFNFVRTLGVNNSSCFFSTACLNLGFDYKFIETLVFQSLGNFSCLFWRKCYVSNLHGQSKLVQPFLCLELIEMQSSGGYHADGWQHLFSNLVCFPLYQNHS